MALNHQQATRLPKDLGGMLSTGISCFAYPDLVKTLGLSPRLPRIVDTGQMLALPDLDVLDALDCDVVYTDGKITNAFDQPELWKPYDFNGRLSALVCHPEHFSVGSDGCIIQQNGAYCSKMVSGSTVFDEVHGGQPVNLDEEIELEDLDVLKRELEQTLLTEDQLSAMAEHCERVRAATDRAVFFNGLNQPLGFRGGIARWSMLCLIEPDHVRAVHALLAQAAITNLQRLLPRIAGSVDVLMLAADDQGTQGSTILPPEVFRSLYVPFYQQINAVAAKLAPQSKRFLHSCGAIHPLIGDIADAGFQVLNPVQWTAGGLGFPAWKDAAGGRLALWGGAVDTQTTLPRGTIDQIQAEARATAAGLGQDGGYIFNAIHNLMADIPGNKVVALYQAGQN